MSELTLEALFDRYTSEAQVKEANATPTVRTGAYRFRYRGHELKVDDRAPGNKFDKDTTLTPGRQSIRLQYTLHDRRTGERKGTIFFDASWEPHYVETESGKRMDGPAKRWGQIVKALGVESRPVGEIIRDVLPNYTFDGFVDESFRMPDGSYKSYRVPQGFSGDAEERQRVLDAERKKLVDEGGEPVNFIQSIFKSKDVE